MKTSERLRRKNWRPLVIAGITLGFGKHVAGSSMFVNDFGLVVWPPGLPHMEPPYFERDDGHGVVHCAQRAEALAKRLAKKRKAAR